MHGGPTLGPFEAAFAGLADGARGLAGVSAGTTVLQVGRSELAARCVVLLPRLRRAGRGCARKWNTFERVKRRVV